MKKREFRIDLMRVFACIMVLFCHSPQPYIGQPGRFLIGITNYYGMAWGPILFFMISGACILWEEKDAKPFLKKRFSRILIPTLFWSIVYIFVQCFVWNTVPSENWLCMIPKILVEPQYGLLWFMYVLIAIYLVAPILSKWLNRSSKKEIELYLGIWCIALALPYLEIFGVDYHFVLESGGVLYYMSGFLWCAVAGYYFRKYGKIEKMKPWHYLASAIALASPVAVFLFKHFTGKTLNASLMLLPMALTAFGFLFIWNVRLQHRIVNEGGKLRRFIESVSKLSFGIYLSHMLVLYPFTQWLSHFNLHFAIHIPLTIVVSFVVSYLLSWLISKFPFGKYIIG